MASAASAYAQDAPLPGRYEVSVGTIWIGRAAAGDKDALETTGSGATTPLFHTSSELEHAFGLDVRASVRVINSLEAEVDATYAKPALRTTITGDVKLGGTQTADETITQYTVGGGVVYYLPYGVRPKLKPFVSGGVAYLRQLHEGNTIVSTGQMYRVGGGVKYILGTSSGLFRVSGLRLDAQLLARSKGVALDNGTKMSPALSASIFLRF